MTACVANPGSLLVHHGRCDCLGARTNPPVFAYPLPQPRFAS